MYTTLRHSRGLQACLIVLLLAPAPSRANGILGDVLHKTVGTVIGKVEKQVTSAARGATQRPTPQPGQPARTDSVRAPSGNAPRNPNAVTLVRTFQPVVPADFATAEDLLGIRLGMSMPQAEQIARKTYPGDPIAENRVYIFPYKEVTVESQPFVRYLQYTKKTASTTDQLLLEFDSPVGDHRIISLSRLIAFDPRPANEPLVSSIQASLFKKFGAPSWKNTGGGFTYEWLFQGKSRVPCPTGGCASNPTNNAARFGLGSTPLLISDVGQTNLTFGGGLFSVGATGDFDVGVSRICGASISNTSKLLADDVVRVQAQIAQNTTDPSKAPSMVINAYYTRPCVDDFIDARSQLQAAAIKRYHALSKTPAAPTF